MSKNARKKFLYRTDPEYRSKHIQKAKEYNQRKIRENKQYLELFNIRKKISYTRDYTRRLIEKVELQEKKLLKLLKEKERIEHDLRRV